VAVVYRIAAKYTGFRYTGFRWKVSLLIR
jgi:hypothetical protein